jgi:hypothetical protein
MGWSGTAEWGAAKRAVGFKMAPPVRSTTFQEAE